MDVTSIMSTVQGHDAAKRVSNSLAHPQSNGLQTAATATRPGGKLAPAATASSSAAAASGSSSSTASGSNITAANFLTLLVAEMQNQDPTQPTDPNAYIQQLVGVNSLQQLISINSELGTALGGTAPGGAPVTTAAASGGVPTGA